MPKLFQNCQKCISSKISTNAWMFLRFTLLSNVFWFSQFFRFQNCQKHNFFRIANLAILLPKEKVCAAIDLYGPQMSLPAMWSRQNRRGAVRGRPVPENLLFWVSGGICAVSPEALLLLGNISGPKRDPPDQAALPRISLIVHSYKIFW